jgi:hypothetical protein
MGLLTDSQFAINRKVDCYFSLCSLLNNQIQFLNHSVCQTLEAPNTAPYWIQMLWPWSFQHWYSFQVFLEDTPKSHLHDLRSPGGFAGGHCPRVWAGPRGHDFSRQELHLTPLSSFTSEPTPENWPDRAESPNTVQGHSVGSPSPEQAGRPGLPSEAGLPAPPWNVPDSSTLT